MPSLVLGPVTGTRPDGTSINAMKVGCHCWSTCVQLLVWAKYIIILHVSNFDILQVQNNFVDRTSFCLRQRQRGSVNKVKLLSSSGALKLSKPGHEYCVCLLLAHESMLNSLISACCSTFHFGAGHCRGQVKWTALPLCCGCAQHCTGSYPSCCHSRSQWPEVSCVQCRHCAQQCNHCCLEGALPWSQVQGCRAGGKEASPGQLQGQPCTPAAAVIVTHELLCANC